MGLLNDGTARSILATGTEMQGSIVGVRVWMTGGGEDSSPVLNLAWAVEAGGSTFGVFQYLNPLSHVRLGMPVDLRVRGEKAVIDWGSERGEGWKPWKVVPERGIHDERREHRLGGARDVWTAATVTVDGRRDRKALFGLLDASDATATVRMGDESWALDVRKRSAPFYATHLFDEGIALPAWVNPSNRAVFIDWIAAAEATPGIGVPPSSLRLTTESFGLAERPMQPKPQPEAAEPGVRPLGKKGEVTFETFLEVSQGVMRDSIADADIAAFAEKFGVPEGTWPDVQMYWIGKMKWNPKLGIQYGRALAAVMPPGAQPVDNA